MNSRYSFSDNFNGFFDKFDTESKISVLVLYLKDEFDSFVLL